MSVAPAAACLLQATICEVSLGQADTDALLLEKLVYRRLVRLERVVAGQGGTVLRRTRHGLLVAFASPTAAVLGGCEMQRRCAVIPQIAGTQIALKIGIHAAELKQPALSGCDPGELVAAELAALLDEGSIVLSGPVFEALSDDLRERLRAMSGEVCGLAWHAIDWNAMPMRAQSSPAVAPVVATVLAREAACPQVVPTIVLRLGVRRFEFGADHPSITIGRDPGNDVMIPEGRISRRHCRIFQRQGSYFLVDVSLNGSYVLNGDGKVHVVHKNTLALSGKGRIGLGTAVGDGYLEFEVLAGS